MIDIDRIRPAGNRLLVLRDDFDEKTAGGLIIPEIAKTAAEGSRQQLKRGRGVVIRVGPGRWEKRTETREHGRDAEGNVKADAAGATSSSREVWTGKREPIDVKVGDRVVFSILADGGDLDELGYPLHTLVDAEEVIAVLEPEDP